MMNADDPGGAPDAEAPLPALWPRVAVFVGVLALAAFLVAVVLRHEAEAPERARAAASGVVTYAVPPEILVPSTRAFGPDRPPLTGPPATGRRITNDQVQLALEVAIKRSTGWTHKVICVPDQPLVVGEVLGCRADTEPPIREIQQSLVLAVVVDDSGHFVWVRGFTGPLSLDALQTPGLTCADMKAGGFPWVAALAYDSLHSRPAEIGRDADGRPCVDDYGRDTVESAFTDQLAA